MVTVGVCCLILFDPPKPIFTKPKARDPFKIGARKFKSIPTTYNRHLNTKLIMDIQQKTVPTTKVYKYRWIVLAIFCLFISLSFGQLLQFTIIAKTLKKFYNVGDFEMDATGLIFFVTFIIGCVPISLLAEKYSLKASCVTAAGLTLVGNLLKLLAADPNRYYMVMVSQSICSIGLVCMANLPTKFASTWFGAKQVSTACAIAILGSQLGAAVGSVIPPYAVSDIKEEEVGNALYNFFTYQAIYSSIVFAITVAFFRSRPKLPPSQSQVQLLLENDNNEGSNVADFKLLARNKDYILVLCSLALANSVFNSFGIILNALYTNYFPDGESDAGLLAMLAIVSGGCIGSLIFGFVLDKTHKFKLVSFGIVAASAVCLVGAAAAIISKSRIGAFIASPLLGFFLNSTLVVGYEYALEVSYPVPESIGCSIFNASNYTFSILITVIAEGIVQAVGYPYAGGFSVAVLVVAAVNVLFISKKLRRRDANLGQENVNGVSGSSGDIAVS